MKIRKQFLLKRKFVSVSMCFNLYHLIKKHFITNTVRSWSIFTSCNGQKKKALFFCIDHPIIIFYYQNRTSNRWQRLNLGLHGVHLKHILIHDLLDIDNEPRSTVHFQKTLKNKAFSVVRKPYNVYYTTNKHFTLWNALGT